MLNQRHFERLSRLHRTAPSSFYADDEVNVGAGRAQATHPVVERDLDASGRVDPTVYHKLLSDAAMLAAGSLVEGQFVTISSFNYYVTQMVGAGELQAAAQVVHARPQLFTVNAVLTDGNGRVLAVGYGTYSPGPVAMAEEEVGTPGESQPAAPEETPPAFDAFATFLDTPFGQVGLN
ncbi:MAG: hotdog fold domain-containing protein [Rhodothermales bacterium]|nr:hotdog fold domain-containing protein [Rhodothermales bacterium]